MEIRTLRYFLTVAQEGSLSAAARTLFITHPALSKQMRELEEELGVKLFKRRSRGVSLTHEGVMLRSKALEIVDLMDRTSQEFSSMASREIEGTVRICSGEGRPVRHIARVAARVRREHPKVHFQLRTSLGDESQDLIDKGLVDFRALIGTVDPAQYDSIELPGSLPWGIIMRREHPLARKESIVSDDLVGVTIACPDLSILETSEEFVSWFGRNLTKLDVAMTFDQVSNPLFFVAEDDLVLLTLEGYISEELSDELCFRPLEPALTARVLFTWRHDRALTPAAQLFLEEMRREFDNG